MSAGLNNTAEKKPCKYLKEDIWSVRPHQHLGQIDIQKSKDSRHEGRRRLFRLTGPGLGLLLHHWLLSLLLLWLILLLLVLCAVFKTVNFILYEDNLFSSDLILLTLLSLFHSQGFQQAWPQLSAGGSNTFS